MKELILDVVARSSEELIKHTKGPGTRYIFSDHKTIPAVTSIASCAPWKTWISRTCNRSPLPRF